MRWMTCILILTVLLAVLTGCSIAGDSNKKQISLIVKSVDSEYWLAVKEGAEKAAKEEGVELVFQGPPTETDINEQLTLVQNAITRQADAIVLAASDSKALAPAAEQADKVNIPVIAIDSGVESDKIKSFIATDNVQAGEKAADTLAGMIGKKGDVAIINFVPGAATAMDREQGFKKGSNKYPDMKTITTQYSQSDKARALSITTDILTAHPNVSGFFATNNRSALGAAQAIQQKGLKGKVNLVAFDADPDEIAALKKGLIQALVVQDPYKMGYLGVKNAVAATQGKKVKKRIDTGVTVVTKGNLHRERIQKLLNPEKRD